MSILVCDDHPLVRAALAMAVAEIADGEAILTARDFPEAWAAAEGETELSLCLIDLHMPGAPALEGVRGLQARAPHAKVVVVTGSEQDQDLLGALALGVDGFVPKSAEVEVLTAALRLVVAGGRYMPARLAELATGQSPSSAAPAEAPYGRLSERQGEVLRHMADGRANKEIALALGLSPATVKNHVAQVIALLGAANRTEAAAKARSLGLV